MSLNVNSNLSPSTLNAISDPVTKKISHERISKIDSNKDGNISAKEASNFGISTKELDAVNKAFKGSDMSCNKNVSFIDEEAKPKEFYEIWKPYGADKNILGTCMVGGILGLTDSGKSKIDQMKTNLGISNDFKNAPKLKELLNITSDPSTISSLEKIGKSHGLSTLNNISGKLVNYFSGIYNEKKLNTDNSVNLNPVISDIKSKNLKVELIKDILHDISVPSSINQQNKGTCGATAVQMKLAIEKPLEYVDISTTLAKGKEYKTLGGKVLKPNESWKNDNNGDLRTLSCKIMQNSFMVGSGNTSYISKKEKNDDGTTAEGVNTMLQNLFDDKDYQTDTKKYTNGIYEFDFKESDNKTPIGLNYSPNRMYGFVEDDIARGRTVPISFPGHEVLVVGIDKTSNPPQVIMNSWGQRFSMSVDEFKKNLQQIESKDDNGLDNKKTPLGSKVIIGN